VNCDIAAIRQQVPDLLICFIVPQMGWDSGPDSSSTWDVPQVQRERTSQTRTDADRIGKAIRQPLSSIMFHYPSQRNGGCNLLGPDPVDPRVIRFVQFRRS